MLALFEMRIREQEEQFRQLALFEKVWQEFHGVHSHDGDVLVVVRIIGVTESLDALIHIILDLHTDFHAHHQGVREKRGKGDHQATIPAPNIGKLDLFVCCGVVWVMAAPIHGGRMRWAKGTKIKSQWC